MSDNKISVSIPNETRPKSCFGVRHFQCLLFFATFLVSFGMKTTLSVAIISMTNQTSSNPDIPIYPEWDNPDVILSSFFWGYLLPQVAAGQLAEYFGAKWFLFATVILAAICQSLVPTMAACFGSTGVIICEILQGINQGFLYPVATNLISNWSPLLERSRFTTFINSGGILGIAVAMSITGAICKSQFGWPTAFYGCAGFGFIWAFIFIILAENSPATHNTISDDEKLFIESSNSVTQFQKKVPTPWRSIFTSLPFYAVVISGCGQSWGVFTLSTQIPSYMSNILKSDISSDSQRAALPYLCRFLVSLLSYSIVDKMIEKKLLKITATRKISQALASFLPAVALIILAFLEDFDETLITFLFIVAVSCLSFQHMGYMVNAIDLAPNHAGTVYGIVCFVNNIFSIMAPLTVGFLGDDKTDPILWRKVFLIAAGFFIIPGVFYMVFASAETQSWNEKEDEEIKECVGIT